MNERQVCVDPRLLLIAIQKVNYKRGVFLKTAHFYDFSEQMSQGVTSPKE